MEIQFTVFLKYLRCLSLKKVKDYTIEMFNRVKLLYYSVIYYKIIYYVKKEY